MAARGYPRPPCAPRLALAELLQVLQHLLGVPASILGNEAAGRLGRRRVLIGVMLASTALAALIGFAVAALAFQMVALQWLWVAVIETLKRAFGVLGQPAREAVMKAVALSALLVCATMGCAARLRVVADAFWKEMDRDHS